MTKTIEVSKEVADEIYFLHGAIDNFKAELQCAKQEIESLKCCGNCEYWSDSESWDDSFKCVNEKSPKVIIARTDKCDHWQKL